jgi:branched-chain amino acid transport system substrate-binding protein
MGEIMRSPTNRSHRPTMRLAAGLLAVALVVAACGGDDDDAGDDGTAAPTPTEAGATPTEAPPDEGTTAPPDEGTTAPPDEGTTAPPGTEGGTQPAGGQMIIQPGECGLGTGEPATGEPLKLGGMATNIPGVDFTWIPQMAALYFDCVNENGGIYGRPIEYSYEDVGPDPAVLTAAATKLVEQDQVLAIVGNTELLECDVNGDYYAEHGYHPIIAGVAPGCFLSDQWSAVNMGPYYSNLGGAQAAVRAGATGKLVVASPDQPGMDFNNTSVQDLAEIEGLEFEGILEPVPIADPAGFANRLVQAAGEGGGVVLNFTGPTVTPLLEAISQQGLVDSVIWASSTPPNDPSVAQALLDCCGTDWDGKFLINAEFNVLDSGLPDNNKMLEIHEAAGAEFPISSFAQMGYLVGKFTTEAMLRMGEGAEYNVETVNAAIYALVGAESDMLCKPWYYSSGVGANVSNNTDRTVVPQGGNMVQYEDCFDIAETPNNPLAEIRAAEAAM